MCRRPASLIPGGLPAICLALALPMWPDARADDVDCPPNLGAITVDGNVIVTGPCRLDGTEVIGNVQIYAGGSLEASRAYVGGSIQAENAVEVFVDETRVIGNIQLDNLTGAESSITRSGIGGSIQLKDNGPRLVVDDNDVDADVQAFGNLGGVDITNNFIDGNLQCKSNSPAPTGGFNTVQGNQEDQCASLELAGSGGNGPGIAGLDGIASAGSSGGGGGAGPEVLLGLASLAGLRARRRRRTA